MLRKLVRLRDGHYGHFHEQIGLDSLSTHPKVDICEGKQVLMVQQEEMAQMTLSSPTTLPSLFPKPSSTRLLGTQSHSPKRSCRSLKIHANLGGGDGDAKSPEKRKFITREQEPEQYWQTAGEREGENPMKTPLPYIIIFGMSTPFVILALGFANGWIKVPIR